MFEFQFHDMVTSVYVGLCMDSINTKCILIISKTCGGWLVGSKRNNAQVLHKLSRIVTHKSDQYSCWQISENYHNFCFLTDISCKYKFGHQQIRNHALLNWRNKVGLGCAKSRLSSIVSQLIEVVVVVLVVVAVFVMVVVLVVAVFVYFCCCCCCSY